MVDGLTMAGVWPHGEQPHSGGGMCRRDHIVRQETKECWLACPFCDSLLSQERTAAFENYLHSILGQAQRLTYILLSLVP